VVVTFASPLELAFAGKIDGFIKAIRGWRGPMNSDPDDTIREIVADLEDIHTSVEELQIDPPDGVNPESFEELETVLEQAAEIADELEEQDEVT
jgi:hypothetical protein